MSVINFELFKNKNTSLFYLQAHLSSLQIFFYDKDLKWGILILGTPLLKKSLNHQCLGKRRK